jgi:2-methylaconitate cis-trans-isomerase PrpF
MAVTGSMCIGSCLMAPATVAQDIARRPGGNPAPVRIEHPSGAIDVMMDCTVQNGAFDLKSAGLLRTARKLMSGHLYVPSTVWTGAASNSPITGESKL